MIREVAMKFGVLVEGWERCVVWYIRSATFLAGSVYECMQRYFYV